jgi:hypothetical protein
MYIGRSKVGKFVFESIDPAGEFVAVSLREMHPVHDQP